MAAVESAGGTSGRRSITLGPMNVPKASDVLARELRERILSGEFPEAMPLPPERDLVEQTKLSRATVREALRVLEVQGLLEIRAGRTGGAFVRHPDQQSVADSVELVIRGRRIDLASLNEVRTALEPTSASLAAERRTDADLELLEAANADIRDSDGDLVAFLDANIQWHISVARASHNELIHGLMNALSHAIYAATSNEEFIDDQVRRTAYEAHARITDAIRAQDPEAAVRRMRRHVHGFATAVLDFEDRHDVTLDEHAG